jgi:hypothetical protein
MNDKELDQAVKDGWVTKKQREKIPNRSYLVYLAKKNKETGHKPKPSMTTEQWAKHQASKASTSGVKGKAKAKGKGKAASAAPAAKSSSPPTKPTKPSKNTIKK